eukprot:7583539-Lingulodinium_polyedra.AAC.1
MSIKGLGGWTWANNEQNLGGLGSRLEKIKQSLTGEDHSILATDLNTLKQQQGENSLEKMMSHFNMLEEPLQDLAKFCQMILAMQKAMTSVEMPRRAAKKARTGSQVSS